MYLPIQPLPYLSAKSAVLSPILFNKFVKDKLSFLASQAARHYLSCYRSA